MNQCEHSVVHNGKLYRCNRTSNHRLHQSVANAMTRLPGCSAEEQRVVSIQWEAK